MNRAWFDSLLCSDLEVTLQEFGKKHLNNVSGRALQTFALLLINGKLAQVFYSFPDINNNKQPDEIVTWRFNGMRTVTVWWKCWLRWFTGWDRWNSTWCTCLWWVCAFFFSLSENFSFNFLKEKELKEMMSWNKWNEEISKITLLNWINKKISWSKLPFW